VAGHSGEQGGCGFEFVPVVGGLGGHKLFCESVAALVKSPWDMDMSELLGKLRKMESHIDLLFLILGSSVSHKRNEGGAVFVLYRGTVLHIYRHIFINFRL
jgi:hypothetical protein